MAMMSSCNISCFLSNCFKLFVLCLFVLPFIESSKNGFSVDLIHRDSPLSPFYNSSVSHFERLKNAIQRSHSRVRHISSGPSPSSSGPIQAQIQYDAGEYLMKVSIGTPPVEIFGIADTGSDLTWIQCKPCTKCFKQEAPLFDLKASATYKTLKCYSKPCKDFGDYDPSTCTKKHNKCQYHVAYGDRSFSNGHLATETFTFGEKHSGATRKIVFGCGHNNNGIFSKLDMGIIGLGGGPASLVSQLSESIQGRFSYCLVPINKGTNVTSTINFGEKALISGSKVVSTPLAPNAVGTYYYLNLEKVIIGNKTFELKSTSTPIEDDGPKLGNIIIDSGTTLTYLPNGEFYDGILSTVKEAINAETTDDPNGDFLLCYKSSEKLNVPYIAIEFTGARLELPQSSTFVEVRDGLVCFTIVPSTSYLSIFGNLLQENFLVSYDLLEKKVSFMPTDCRNK